MTGYRSASTLTADERGRLLALETALAATPQGFVDHPTFFSGFVAQPAVVAAGLLAVADVAATRYYDASSARRRSHDPVVTASGDRLRFESMSGCNGVYARLDLLDDGIDSGEIAFGTTNVDVNQPLRSGLARIGRHDLLHLAVGTDELRVATPGGTHVERAVELPDRWIRGFAETPAVAARMTPAAEVDGVQAGTFLSQLPSGTPGPTIAVAPSPRGLRLTTSATPGAVQLGGTARLTAARRVARFVNRLRVHTEPGGAGGWVFDLPGARLTLLLSPEPYRGFSGEGGLLDQLTSDAGGDAARVLEHLAWEPAIDPAWLELTTGLSADRVATALAALSASGKVGYDLAEGATFHRELPHDADRVRRDHPRLTAARELAGAGLVVSDGGRWRTGAPGHEQWVDLGGAYPTCTCRWWARYRGGRGPCTHVLAATLAENASTR